MKREEPLRILHCADHPAVDAVARCSRCTRLLCNECYRFRAGEEPVCARCVYESETRPQRRISLAAAFVSLAYGGGFVLVRRYDLFADYGVVLVVGAVAALVIGVLIGLSGRTANAVAVERRELEEDVQEGALDVRGSPYRASVRRVVQAAAPRLSGRLTVLVVGLSLASSAVLLPASMSLPRWVEIEVVFSAWWLLLAATLVVLLYRGFRLSDDWVYFAPWDRPSASDVAEEGNVSGAEDETRKKKKSSKKKGTSGGIGWASGCDGCGAIDAGEGAIAVIGIALALGIALGAAWILVELAMPLVFFMIYWVLMKAIARAATDHHDCEKDLGKSLVWGVVWATIYVAPLALLTFVVHRALLLHHG